MAICAAIAWVLLVVTALGCEFGVAVVVGRRSEVESWILVDRAKKVGILVED